MRIYASTSGDADGRTAPPVLALPCQLNLSIAITLDCSVLQALYFAL